MDFFQKEIFEYYVSKAKEHFLLKMTLQAK